MYTAIIPAAGLGQRMGLGYNKVLLELEGKPIIARTVEAFQDDPNCAEIHIATREAEVETLKNCLSGYSKVCGIHIGGAARQDSIYNCLIHVQNAQYIFVHDGARPFVSSNILSNIYDSVVQHDAVICGVNVKDTLKKVVNNQVVNTIDRETTIQVHTPQAFKYDILLKAYEHAKKNHLQVTDDSMMVEAIGETIHVVSSSYDNVKITTKEDLNVARLILERKSDSHD